MPELLVEQPGKEVPRFFVAAAGTNEGDLPVVYSPKGGTIVLKTEVLKLPATARWFNPRTGKWTNTGSISETTQSFTAPDDNDWLLCIKTH